jgi:hypothetical protein
MRIYAKPHSFRIIADHSPSLRCVLRWHITAGDGRRTLCFLYFAAISGGNSAKCQTYANVSLHKGNSFYLAFNPGHFTCRATKRPLLGKLVWLQIAKKEKASRRSKKKAKGEQLSEYYFPWRAISQICHDMPGYPWLFTVVLVNNSVAEWKGVCLIDLKG